MGTLPEMNGMADAYIRPSVLAGTVNNTTSFYDVFPDITTAMDIPAASVSPFEWYIKIIVPSIFGLICVLGLFGNLLVIIVVVSDKHMRNTTNILILSLAVADLLFLVICVPVTGMKYVLPFFPFGDIGCKISTYAMYVCAYASVYTLVIMSLDRYLAVVHAIRSMTWRSERNTWIIIAVIWILILACNSPLIVQYGKVSYTWPPKNESRTACINTMDHEVDNKKMQRIFFGFFFCFGYVIPLGVTVLMYGLMLKRLLYGVVPGGGNQSAESIRAKKRVTRMVVIVVVIFAICWLPIQIISFWDQFGEYPKTQGPITVMIASNCLAYMNSCVNPILYAFLSENFRRSFKKILCCSGRSFRGMDYERTHIRFTTTEKETKSTVVSKMYTPV